jgi:hypothetical protein
MPNKELSTVREVNIDLVIIRNKAYALAMCEHNMANREDRVADNRNIIRLYELSQQLLES